MFHALAGDLRTRGIVQDAHGRHGQGGDHPQDKEHDEHFKQGEAVFYISDSLRQLIYFVIRIVIRRRGSTELALHLVRMDIVSAVPARPGPPLGPILCIQPTVFKVR